MKILIIFCVIISFVQSQVDRPPPHQGGGGGGGRPNGGGGGGGGRPNGGGQNNGGGPPRPGPGPRPPRPGPNPNPNPSIQSSVNSSILNDLYNKGLNITLSKIKDPINSDKTLLQIANTIQLPSSICTTFKRPKCDWNNKYQYLDGSCNNMNEPWLGKTETPYKRFLAPEYGDTLSSPRSLSVSKNPLPNTRVISRTIQNDNGQFESTWTHLGTLFGQFIAHDLTSLSSTSDSFGVPIDCPCNSTNSACLSVPMPSNENIMVQSCMQFTRSSAVFPTYDCKMGYREQLNLLSSHLDGTQIYGESFNVSLQLRKFSGGLFSTTAGVTARPYLIKSDSLCTNTNDTQMFCFKAGEFRTTENLG